MIADFDGAVSNLCGIGKRGSWYVAFVPLRSGVSEDDRRQRAQEMSDASADWHKVVRADNRLITWDALQRRVVGKGVDPADWGFPHMINLVLAARRALVSTAGYDKSGEKRLEPGCKSSYKDWGVTVPSVRIRRAPALNCVLLAQRGGRRRVACERRPSPEAQRDDGR